MSSTLRPAHPLSTGGIIPDPSFQNLILAHLDPIFLKGVATFLHMDIHVSSQSMLIKRSLSIRPGYTKMKMVWLFFFNATKAKIETGIAS